jgi:hypothetical protein
LLKSRIEAKEEADRGKQHSCVCIGLLGWIPESTVGVTMTPLQWIAIAARLPENDHSPIPR